MKSKEVQSPLLHGNSQEVLLCNKLQYLPNTVPDGLDTSTCLQVRMWVVDQGNPDETEGNSSHTL